MSKPKPIYVITTIRKNRNQLFERTHCVGWHYFEKNAIESVEYNNMDLQECEYTHAVIEETYEGIYCHTTKEIWFKWEKSKEKFVRCPQPKWAEHTCNWGIG